MPSRIFRVRLDASLASAVTSLAESSAQPVSAVLRAAVKDLVASPERLTELLPAHMPYVLDDERTERQQATWARDREQLVHVDMSELLAQMSNPRA